MDEICKEQDEKDKHGHSRQNNLSLIDSSLRDNIN